MTDVDILRLIGWPGIAALAFSVYYTLYPIARANGARPFLIGYAVIAALVCTHAAGAVFLAYRLDAIQSEGLAKVAVYYSRVFPALVGGVVLWTGWKWRRLR